jgi:site-specific recombinase XerD
VKIALVPQLELFANAPRTIPIRLPLGSLAEPRTRPRETPRPAPFAAADLGSTQPLLPLVPPPAPRAALDQRPAAAENGPARAGEMTPAPPAAALGRPSIDRRVVAAAATPARTRGTEEDLAAHAFANDLERLVEAFLLSAIGNPNTARAYRANILRAIRMTRAERLDQLTVGDLVAFRAAVRAADLAPASQALALFALRSFLTWAAAVVGLPFPLKSARVILRADKVVTLRPPAILTVEEVRAVIAAATADNGRRAMVLVLLGAGLRVCELCGLEGSDVHVDDAGVAVMRVKGKGRKDRLVPLREPIAEELRRYLAKSGRRLGDAGPIFLAHDTRARSRGGGHAISERSAARRIDRVLHEAGITKAVRVHGLRHTFSTAVIRNGGSLLHLGDLLGHSSLVTTARYVSRLGLELDELQESIPATLVGG